MVIVLTHSLLECIQLRESFSGLIKKKCMLRSSRSSHVCDYIVMRHGNGVWAQGEVMGHDKAVLSLVDSGGAGEVEGKHYL